MIELVDTHPEQELVVSALRKLADSIEAGRIEVTAIRTGRGDPLVMTTEKTTYEYLTTIVTRYKGWEQK